MHRLAVSFACLLLASPVLAQKVPQPSKTIIVEGQEVSNRPDTVINGNVDVTGVGDRVNTTTASGTNNITETNIGAIGSNVSITGNTKVIGVGTNVNTTTSGTGNVARTNIGTVGK